MRHNQNARRGSRGGSRGGHHHHHGGQQNNNGQRRINPRVHTFDSNGPDVRVRGTAYQIHDKYTALARDAASAGDRVLAESYLQHAEHYQRLINELTEEYNLHQQQFQQQQPHYQPQPYVNGESAVEGGQPAAEASSPAPNGHDAPAQAAAGEEEKPQEGQRRTHHRPQQARHNRRGETEAV